MNQKKAINLIISAVCLLISVYLLANLLIYDGSYGLVGEGEKEINFVGEIFGLFGYFGYLLPFFVGYFPYFLKNKTSRYGDELPIVDKVGMYIVGLVGFGVGMMGLLSINVVPTDTMKLTGGLIGLTAYEILESVLPYFFSNIVFFIIVVLSVKVFMIKNISYLGLVEWLGGRAMKIVDKNYKFEPTIFEKKPEKFSRTQGFGSIKTDNNNDDRFTLQIERKIISKPQIAKDKTEDIVLSQIFDNSLDVKQDKNFIAQKTRLDNTHQESIVSNNTRNNTGFTDKTSNFDKLSLLGIAKDKDDATLNYKTIGDISVDASMLHGISLDKSSLRAKLEMEQLSKPPVVVELEEKVEKIEKTIFDMNDFDFTAEISRKKSLGFPSQPKNEDASQDSLKIKDAFKDFYGDLDKEIVQKAKTIQATHIIREEKVEIHQKPPVKMLAKLENFVMPRLNLLFPKQDLVVSDDLEFLVDNKAMEVAKILAEFGISAEVQEVIIGPVITRVLISLQAGVKVSKLQSVEKDLARALHSPNLRIIDLVPNTSYVGIEIDSIERKQIMLSNIIDTDEFREDKSNLILALGLDITGKVRLFDLTIMPHLLIAGTTGSGKSVGLNTMIMSMLYKHTPEHLRFIFIDPKRLELNLYNGLPHLLHPVICDLTEAISVLKWCIAEMDRRYKLLAKYEVRNIAAFNEKIAMLKKTGDLVDADEKELPYICIMIDELADLMLSGGKRIEELIIILAQKARASGIHLILATQRPSVDVITGLLKANIPSRVSYMVSTKIDSRTILDTSGAEKLLGKGDLLFMPVGSSFPERMHGPFVVEKEIDEVVEHWKTYPVEMEQIELDTNERPSTINENNSFIDKDELYEEVYELMLTEAQVHSISAIQRKFSIGFNRAAKIIDQLEADGIISKPNNRGKRILL